MGPVAETLTSGLHDVASALNTTTFEGGPRAPIGQCVPVAPSGSDTTLCYIRPLGHGSAGDVVYGPHADKRTVEAEIAAGDLERVYLPANAGGQVWMYIRASGNILRGNPVSVDVSDFATLGLTYEVTAAGVDSADIVKGVAQWNIDDDQFGWVLVSGVGVVRSNGAFSIGDRLTVTTTAGEVDTAADTDNPSFAVALAAAGAGDEWVLADISCTA